MLAVAALTVLLSGQSALAFAPSRISNVLQSKDHRAVRKPSSGPLYLGDFFNFGKKEEEPEASLTDTVTDEEPEDEGFYDEDDPIEKIFGVFFGKKEKEPMGMKRFGQERFPEQYPAVLDEWADPVQEDDAEMASIRPLLKNTNLETRKLRLIYDANRDGWDPAVFHSKVDKQSGCVVLCTTRAGIKCGGYNPKGWVGYGEARGSIAAFLFILGGKYAKDGAPAIKLRKVGGPGLAQMDLPESGPQFSPDALVINMDQGNPRAARSKLGSYYERLPDGTNSLFGKDAGVQLKDLKVYNGVYEEGEYIPFTDAEPFALY
eukprot:CAMPEP_0196139920 /NCGR_PEP_ID=MMETSP0910-20130528/7023_1 /TAXON_ID=49265 /ORGANISM="Thalassiosira rotula, Strain GSO102" /LENGTH=317 /DNA_ID=CAMNT_0041400711 /DNA_START=23 /DNA_END=976 /DNA_ORIENTATION=+